MNNPTRTKEHRKSFLVSAGAGAVFGLVAGIVFQQTGYSPWPPVILIPAITLIVALIAGSAGLIGSLMESRLSRWGLKNPLLRLTISFGSVALGTLAITFTAITLLGGAARFKGLNQYTLVGTAAGITFGAIFALLNFRWEAIRQRLMVLELENRHLADLAAREELLREAARNLAVAEERNRMARDIHDSVAQGVHGIIYSLHSLRPLLADSSRGKEILGHLEETAAGTLGELRSLVMELSPSPLEDHGLAEALRLHCDIFARRQKLALSVNLDYNGKLQPEQEIAIYRITQEALANVQKHAQATHVWVSLQSGDKTILSVRDNGKGFDTEAAALGHGLRNIASRARQSGGSLEIHSSPGLGTTLTVEFSGKEGLLSPFP
jgi:signal transduction histidine kinase